MFAAPIEACNPYFVGNMYRRVISDVTIFIQQQTIQHESKGSLAALI